MESRCSTTDLWPAARHASAGSQNTSQIWPDLISDICLLAFLHRWCFLILRAVLKVSSTEEQHINTFIDQDNPKPHAFLTMEVKTKNAHVFPHVDVACTFLHNGQAQGLG